MKKYIVTLTANEREMLGGLTSKGKHRSPKIINALILLGCDEIKPWLRKGWVIPPEQNGSFVANMEMVLDVYKRPFDSGFPVVCMDESPKQLIGETKTPILASPGQPAKYDYEYKRCGVCNIFMACEPLAGKRMVKITERKTKRDWAYFLEDIAAQYKSAEKITLVMDNLNTHTPLP